MASRILAPTARLMSRRPLARSFQTCAMLRAEGPVVVETLTPLPVRKPVGAFRGGLFGFLLGSTLAGAGVYYYVLEEYKVSNELLTEDIYTLQATVQKVHGYVQSLEEKVDALERKK